MVVVVVAGMSPGLGFGSHGRYNFVSMAGKERERRLTPGIEGFAMGSLEGVGEEDTRLVLIWPSKRTRGGCLEPCV
jgi:hypothetical protein